MQIRKRPVFHPAAGVGVIAITAMAVTNMPPPFNDPWPVLAIVGALISFVVWGGVTLAFYCVYWQLAEFGIHRILRGYFISESDFDHKFGDSLYNRPFYEKGYRSIPRTYGAMFTAAILGFPAILLFVFYDTPKSGWGAIGRAEFVP